MADIDADLDACGVPLADAATVVGIAGTITTLAAAVLDLPAYDAVAVHGSAPTSPTCGRRSTGSSR